MIDGEILSSYAEFQRVGCGGRHARLSVIDYEILCIKFKKTK